MPAPRGCRTSGAVPNPEERNRSCQTSCFSLPILNGPGLCWGWETSPDTEPPRGGQVENKDSVCDKCWSIASCLLFKKTPRSARHGKPNRHPDINTHCGHSEKNQTHRVGQAAVRKSAFFSPASSADCGFNTLYGAVESQALLFHRVTGDPPGLAEIHDRVIRFVGG
jgi:hypothetical protein